MTATRKTFSWPPVQLDDDGTGPSLGSRFAPVLDDRASTSASIVREVSEILVDWLAARPDDWAWDTARSDLAPQLAELSATQGWRGPVAHWLATLEGILILGAGGELPAPAREMIAEELGLWLGGAGAGEGLWDGRPLTAGRRLPDRARCAAPLLSDLERGEVLLVHGFSETVALALEEVQGRGLSPEVVLSEGGPDLGGRRMARRLAPSGVKLRLVYDAALPTVVARIDRVWIGTEAIGAQALLGRVGTLTLLEEARRREVPSAVLATTDKLLPEGDLALPTWCEGATWLLWERAPEGVRVESQAFEAIPLDLLDFFSTEQGRLSAAELSLQALRTRVH